MAFMPRSLPDAAPTASDPTCGDLAVHTVTVVAGSVWLRHDSFLSGREHERRSIDGNERDQEDVTAGTCGRACLRRGRARCPLSGRGCRARRRVLYDAPRLQPRAP